MKIIGITGRAGTGKDTVADILVKARGYQRLSFADPIRQMVECLGIDCTSRDAKETPVDWLGKSPRFLMQTLGTEWGRQLVNPAIWLKHMERRIALAHELGCYGVVIPDVRFDNEAMLLSSMQAELWHIERPGVPRVENHASESGIDSKYITVYLYNGCALDELYDRVLRLETAEELTA